MKVNGYEKRNVEIEINPKEAVLALAKNYNLYGLLKPDSDAYFKLEEKNDDTYLCKYENYCYHGSPNYEKTYERQLSEDESSVAKSLLQLYRIIERH